MITVKMSGSIVVMNCELTAVILTSMASVLSTKPSCISVIEMHLEVLSLVKVTILCSSR